MLCRKCGNYVDPRDSFCSACGAMLEKTDAQDTGVRAIRQGKKTSVSPAAQTEKRTTHRRSGASRVVVDPSLSRRFAPETQAPVTFDEGVSERAAAEPLRSSGARARRSEGALGFQAAGLHAAKRRNAQHKVSAHMVNWAHLAIVIAVLVVLMGVGAYFYLTRSATGQRIMARMGMESTSTALWEVGEEAMDTGDIETAIAKFEQARLLDGEENVNVNGLLLLGSAYEANGQTEEAMELYTYLYTDVVPNRPEAYRSMIRLLQAEDRDSEAAELMQLAYEMTEVTSFRTMRTELLPVAPETDLTAGTYSEKKYLTITSSEGYDIYYVINQSEAVLPEDGVKYTEPIYLDEGVWDLRAVSVNEDLVSDELTGTYKVIMPSPQKPRSSLAPNTYKQRQRIWLKPGEENEDDEDIIIYYTIDGSTPDEDSPIYTGEPFWLPGGRVTLRAVAVNGYGKVSNELSVLYKIEAKPYPLTAYTEEDTVSGFTLGETAREDFLEEYGTGESMEEVSVAGIDTACQKYTYSWGYAVMGKTQSSWVIIEVYFTSDRFSGPRKTGIGDTEDYVVGKFRDMGQVESPSGNRGLYDNSDGEGKIYKLSDGTKEIRYSTEVSDGGTWTLVYKLNTSGIVAAIDMIYTP